MTVQAYYLHVVTWYTRQNDELIEEQKYEYLLDFTGSGPLFVLCAGIPTPCRVCSSMKDFPQQICQLP